MARSSSIFTNLSTDTSPSTHSVTKRAKISPSPIRSLTSNSSESHTLVTDEAKQEFDGNLLIAIMSHLLTKLAGINQNCEIPKKFSAFCDISLFLTINFREYLKNLNSDLIKDSHEFEMVAIYALIYLDRCAHKKLFITPATLHRLTLTAILMAIKFICDSYDSNKYIAKVGDISLSELNKLEHLFFDVVDLNLFVTLDQYQNFIADIKNYFRSVTKQAMPQYTPSIAPSKPQTPVANSVTSIQQLNFQSTANSSTSAPLAKISSSQTFTSQLLLYPNCMFFGQRVDPAPLLPPLNVTSTPILKRL